MTDANDTHAPPPAQLHGAIVPQAGRGELSSSSDAMMAMQEVQAALIIARENPRNEDQIWAAILKSCKRPSFAEGCSYSFPRGTTQISGPSIKLAREMKRLWGNFDSRVSIVNETFGDGTPDNPGTRKIRATAWDLQTNARAGGEDSFQKLIQRKQWVGQGADRREETRWLVPDERDLRELTNRRGALLERNAILALLPPDFIDDARGTADDTVEAKIEEDPEFAKKSLIAGMARLSITPAMMEVYLQHPLAQCSPAELANLRKIFQSVRDGHSTWQEYLPDPDPENAAGAGNGADRRTAADLKPARKKDAKKKARKPAAKKKDAEPNPSAEAGVIAPPAPPAGEDPPWECLTEDGVQELRRRLEAKGQSEATLMAKLGRDDLKLEQLPKPDFGTAMGAIDDLPDLSKTESPPEPDEDKKGQRSIT